MANPETLASETLSACVSHCLLKQPSMEYVLISLKKDSALWGDQVLNRAAYVYWFYYSIQQQNDLKFNCLCASGEAFEEAEPLSPIKCKVKCPEMPNKR